MAEVELPSRFREIPHQVFWLFNKHYLSRREYRRINFFRHWIYWGLFTDLEMMRLGSLSFRQIWRNRHYHRPRLNEGAAYSSPTNATTDLHEPMSNGGHFYTANTFEKNILLQDSSFTYEGIAYQVYSTAEPPQGSIPVIRYLSSSGSHLYSTSQYEQSILDASSQWMNEGIAWYGEAI